VLPHPAAAVALVRLQSPLSLNGRRFTRQMSAATSAPVGARFDCWGIGSSTGAWALRVGTFRVAASSGDGTVKLEHDGALRAVHGDEGAACAPSTDPYANQIAAVFTRLDRLFSGQLAATTVQAQLGHGVSAWVDDLLRSSGVRRGVRPLAIYSAHSRKCLDVPAASLADGAPINQFSCHGGLNQQWYGDHGVVSGRVMYVNAITGKCITVAGGSTSAGAGLVQMPCSGAPSQLFEPLYANPGIQYRSHHAPSKCWKVPGLSVADGVQLQQDACAAEWDQRWYWWWR
jgi:hypothetical protein